VDDEIAQLLEFFGKSNILMPNKRDIPMIDIKLKIALTATVFWRSLL
jgi:hypothetical protein